MQRGFKFGKTREGLLLNRQELEAYTEEELLATVRVVQVAVSPCCQTRSFATRKTRALPYRCLRCRNEFASVEQAPYYIKEVTMDAHLAASRYRLRLISTIEKRLKTLSWVAFYEAVEASLQGKPSFPTAPEPKQVKNHPIL